MSTKVNKGTPPTLSLYWCTTADHDEDWFVVAPDEREAARFHEDAEGYDEGDAEAVLVCPVPPDARDAVPGWPSEELLLDCGAQFLPDAEGVRVVRIADKIYVEGDIVMNAAMRLGLFETD